MNTLKTAVLLAGMSALMVAAGSLINGARGAMVFFMISLVINFISYFFSDTITIRATRAREISEGENPQLYATVRRLCQRADLPMPRIYMTPDMQPNAFATGRDPEHAVVAVTSGIMQILTPSELEGVLAHELAHVKNRDILIGTVAAAMASVIGMIANIAQWAMIFGGGRDDEDNNWLGSLVMIILAPIMASIIQMAISRSREYEADATGARIAGTPRGLASALMKLEAAAHQIPMQVDPAVSHMYISNPFPDKLLNLFSTHPSTKDRVEKLNNMQMN